MGTVISSDLLKKLKGKEKLFIHSVLSKTFPDTLVLEYKGIPNRRFSFDWAVPSLRLAVEYEGIFGGGKSRHTNVKGYTNDCEKYNLAALNGWTVLRYTAKNYKDIEKDLIQFLNG